MAVFVAILVGELLEFGKHRREEDFCFFAEGLAHNGIMAEQSVIFVGFVPLFPGLDFFAKLLYVKVEIADHGLVLRVGFK